jgi:hypothetical protein
MVLKNTSSPLYRTSAFPSGQALAETVRSPAWRVLGRWRPTREMRRVARIGDGIRRARALLKRLDAEKANSNRIDDLTRSCWLPALELCSTFRDGHLTGSSIVFFRIALGFTHNWHIRNGNETTPQ